MLVEDEERFEDLEGVLIGSCLSDFEVKILVRKGLLCSQPLEGEGRSEKGCLICSRVCDKNQRVAST